MFCPFCGDSGSRVVDSRVAAAATRRRRECPSCERRFTTYERYDEGPLHIRKRDGSRQPFEREKLLAGLDRAAIKRPIEREQLEAIVDRIVAELRSRGGVPEANDVGELALLGLRELDPVAYVRFASVYRMFADVAEFEAELDRIERERPVQGDALFAVDDNGHAARPRGGSVRSESQSTELPPEPGKTPLRRRGRGPAKESSLEGKRESLED